MYTTQWVSECMPYQIVTVKASIILHNLSVWVTLILDKYEQYTSYKIWGFAWWKSVSSRFAVTPCVISTIAKLRYRFWKEPNRTTRISTVAKWEIWFRENHGDFTGFSSTFWLACSNLLQVPNDHHVAILRKKQHEEFDLRLKRI